VSRRCLLLLALVAPLLLAPAPDASAESCRKVDRGLKCVSLQKQACVSGNPTVCTRSRNTCVRRSGWFRCTYVAKRARCRGVDGRRCRTTWTRCESTPRSKTCRDTTDPYCAKRRDGSKRCAWERNRCVTRGARYRCEWRRTVNDCTKAGTCVREVRSCVSRSGDRRAACRLVSRTRTGGGDGGGGGGGPGSGGGPAGGGGPGATPAPSEPGTGPGGDGGDDGGPVIGEL